LRYAYLYDGGDKYFRDRLYPNFVPVYEMKSRTGVGMDYDRVNKDCCGEQMLETMMCYKVECSADDPNEYLEYSPTFTTTTTYSGYVPAAGQAENQDAWYARSFRKNNSFVEHGFLDEIEKVCGIKIADIEETGNFRTSIKAGYDMSTSSSIEGTEVSLGIPTSLSTGTLGRALESPVDQSTEYRGYFVSDLLSTGIRDILFNQYMSISNTSIGLLTHTNPETNVFRNVFNVSLDYKSQAASSATGSSGGTYNLIKYQADFEFLKSPKWMIDLLGEDFIGAKDVH
jgi:hypothetical protein